MKSQKATLRGHLQEDSSVNTIKGGSHRSQPNQKPWNSRPQNGPFNPNQYPWNRPQSQSGPFNMLNAHGWCCTKKPICTRRPRRGNVCSRCGKTPPHGRMQCPPRDAVCHKCSLNLNASRERHILLSVEQILAQLGGTTVFSKLDANSSFWQIELSKSLLA